MSLDPNIPRTHPDRLVDAAPTQASETSQASMDPEATSYKRARQLVPDGKITTSQHFQPRRVGNYELLEEIARGGMGVVYRAREIKLPRPIALKMILAGQFATPEAMERFQIEARANAALDHPNIVPVYEVGEIEGRPFLSMPFMNGGSLQQLLAGGPVAPRAAARLLRPVADAVQYAHVRGIIHRDIKPQNILLHRGEGSQASEAGIATLTQGSSAAATAAGKGPTPRLTDFGLARVAEEESRLTVAGEPLGTPSYMPPEQAAGRTQDIGPSSDVYSLGAVLYSMLTGRPPFQSASTHETLRQVRESEPVSPRQLNPVVPRDLETICLKCLAKEPVRRYQSAAALAEDLERFLTGLPVQARPVGAVERGWRWCRRNKAVASLLAALALVVVGSLAGLTVLYLNAVRLRQMAEKRHTEAHAVSRFYEDHVLAAARPKGWAGGLGKDVTLKEALDQAAPMIENAFPGQPEPEAAARHALGVTYYHLGLFCAANLHLEKAYALRQQVLGPEHPEALASLHDLARVRWKQSKLAEAIAFERQALEKRRLVLGAEHKDTLFSQLNLGLFLSEFGQFDEAETLLREAIEVCSRTLGPDHQHTLHGQNDLAVLLYHRGRLQESVELDRRTLAGRRRSLGVDHPDTLRSMGNLATGLARVGKFAESEALQRQALDARRRVLGTQHEEVLWSQINLGRVLTSQGKLRESETLLRQTLEVALRMLGPDNRWTLTAQTELANVLKDVGKLEESTLLHNQVLTARRRLLGIEHPDSLWSQNLLAEVLRCHGQLDEADKLLRQGLEIQQCLLGCEHFCTLTTQNNLANTLGEEGAAVEAEKLFRQVLAGRRKSLGPDHPDVASTLADLGLLLIDNGRATEAEPMVRECLGIREKHLPGAHWRIADARGLCGACLAAQAKFVEAERFLVAGYECMILTESTPPKRITWTLDRIIDLYDQWGKPTEAKEWLKRRPLALK
jgi:tetratricopeptide (TPR) repeat protein